MGPRYIYSPSMGTATQEIKIELPARVKITSLLPETKMAVFMELIPHPTKKATVRDWELILDELIWKHFMEYVRPNEVR